MPLQISVIGANQADPALLETAYEVGRLSAARGWVVVTGGLGGVMEAASRGAADAGGLTIGILPSYDASTANPYVRVVIPTGLGYARNVLVVSAGSGVIAVGGRYGTLSEIAFALNAGRPVVGVNTWSAIEGVRPAASAAEAVEIMAPLLATP